MTWEAEYVSLMFCVSVRCETVPRTERLSCPTPYVCESHSQIPSTAMPTQALKSGLTDSQLFDTFHVACGSLLALQLTRFIRLNVNKEKNDIYF